MPTPLLGKAQRMREHQRGERSFCDRPDCDHSDSSPVGSPADAEGDADGLSRREFLQQAAAGTAAVGVIGGQPVLFGALAPPARSELIPVTLKINGQTHDLHLDPRVTLLDALRENVGLTGTKKGCDHGQCGACTVLSDGRRIYSCLTLAAMQAGAEVTTIEGLADGETLHPMQAAFIAHDGFQCGYCTSGQICSAVGLLNEGHAHSEAEIRELMSGNICRCGAYPNIVRAIQDVQAGRV
jgi:xanthine dehydrogenase YagT iron-sulfur-binding subunit